MKVRLLLVLLLAALYADAQQSSNLRSKVIILTPDSLVLDTLSIIPNSLLILRKGEVLDANLYRVDYSRSTLHFGKDTKNAGPDTLTILYRVFPYRFEQKYQRRDLQSIQKSKDGLYNPFTFRAGEKGSAELFKFDGLSKNGSISRGISFGNNQDVIVNSSLNLQLSGRLSEDIDILAAITDENIPFQPEGNTQQIQEFDKVFIQFSRKNDRLIIGDFDTRNPEGYFMRYYKKGQGLSLGSLVSLGEKNRYGTMKVAASGAIAKGKFARNTFVGEEGNQGPYRLRGNNNETFLIILSNSEKIFINGQRLVRGQENDYIIDYNTAEITFMPRQLITKDSRIVAEFEYSDRNYARTLFTFSNEYEHKDLKIRFGFFSEQDAKNQPLLQTLTDEQKRILSQAGDSLNQAISFNVDSVAFDPDQILYKKVFIDGAPVYVYSTNRDSAHFRLGFSLVGPGRGDYNPKLTAANGKVYEWVGKGRGSYLPITLLVSPKRQQMYTLGADYRLSPTSLLSTEVAASNNNINLYSSLDKKNDTGVAFKTDYFSSSTLQRAAAQPWKLKTNLHYEQQDRNFRFLERFRSTEFERDWNLGLAPRPEKEILTGLSFDFNKEQTGTVGYQFRTLLRGSVYSGVQNVLTSALQWRKYRFSSGASYLSSRSTDNSGYLRHRAELSRNISRFVAGIREEQEINRFSKEGADTLEKSSFMFYEWQAYVRNADTSTNRFTTQYGQRFDFLPKSEEFRLAALARTLSFTSELARNSRSRFASTSSYRKLDVVDSLIGRKPESSLVNRFDYNLVLFKGALNSTTYYQVATGQELRRDYAFLEVTRGKGTHIWNDYNDNGIKERNEYEIAIFPDTARFVRILIPTNEYIKTHANEFSQVLYIAPAAFFQSPKGFKKMLSRFSNQLAYQLNRKTLKEQGLSELAYLNPFTQSVDDTSLISTQSSVRNILYFNRSQSRFGMDLNWQSSRNKVLLSDGFEYKTLDDLGSNIRWDISKSFNHLFTLRKARKRSGSEYFLSRVYDLLIYEAEPRLSYQPTNTFRFTLGYRISDKTNTAKPVNPERAVSNRYSAELKINSVRVGSLQIRSSFINLLYNADDNTPIAYEILEGLRKGKNITWGVSLQRNLSNNTQLNLNYDGRKSEGTGSVHTGGVQLRAFF